MAMEDEYTCTKRVLDMEVLYTKAPLSPASPLQSQAAS